MDSSPRRRRKDIDEQQSVRKTTREKIKNDVDANVSAEKQQIEEDRDEKASVRKTTREQIKKDADANAPAQEKHTKEHQTEEMGNDGGLLSDSELWKQGEQFGEELRAAGRYLHNSGVASREYPPKPCWEAMPSSP